MPSRIKHDICVVTGTYRDGQGQDKKRWQKVGVELETEQGGRLILLERWFNPAGIPDPEGRGTVMLSMFDPKGDSPLERNSGPPSDSGVRRYGEGASCASQPPPAKSQGLFDGPPKDDFEDDIPF